MRYSTVFKFIAFVLCAATLLGMVGSAAGIVFLTELGGKTVNEAYMDQLRSQSLGYGFRAVEIYASETLGGAHQNLINQQYGHNWGNQYFNWSRVGYTLYDSEGNAVQEQQMPGSYEVAYEFEDLPVSGQYMKVIATTPREEYYPQETEPAATGGTQVTVMPSQESTVIGAVYVDYTGGHQEAWPQDGTQLGLLRYTGGDTLTFVSNIGDFPVGDGWYPNHILMLDMGGNAVYEASDDTYVVQASALNEDGTYYIYLPAGTITTAALAGITYTDGDYTSYDAIPTQGITVSFMNVTYSNAQSETVGSEGVATPDLLGTIFHDRQGNAEFHSTNPITMDIPGDCIITHISFMDAGNNLIFDASCPSGVGNLTNDENGYLVFRGAMPGTEIPETVPQETVAEEIEATESPEESAGLTGFATEKLNIYSAPSAQSQQVGTVDAWQEVEILKQQSFEGKNWGLISGGWILMDRILMEDKTSFETYTAAAEADLTVYSTPSDGRKLGTIEAGEEYEVLKQEEVNGKPWALTNAGWILMENTAQAADAAVTEDRNIYASPNTKAKILGTLEAGKEPAILKQETVDGTTWGLTQEGWIILEEAVRVAETVPEETTVEATEPVMARAKTLMPEKTVPATEPKAKAAPEQPDSEAAPMPTEVPFAATTAMAYPEEDVEKAIYYDSELRQDMVAEYVMEVIPEGYTMNIQLARGALRSELGWTLLRLAEVFRSVLLEFLGICIAVFVLCVVHLCCSAGRTRRTNEVRAGGLNRIPLDLYLVGGSMAGIGLVALAMEGSQYFARNDEQLAIILLGACSYLLCLLIVGFFFAFVAQIKTPGGFWWRHSFCGWCIKLMILCCTAAADICIKCWLHIKPLVGRFFPWLGRTGKVLWTFTKKAALWLWDTGKRMSVWLAAMARTCFSWTTGKLALFFGMLPITWQFLATGFILVFLLYAMMRTYKVGYILLGFGIFFAVILYAASAFAILLENAKKMSKGDLDTKVDDRMLIGGFKEFAGELNDLAGVAVVAAQKQLKSERMKTELITNVSHDIKTPLTSIINYVDLLQKPHTPQQQEQYLEVLDRQSHRLKKLIDDLMEMSKASTGNLAVDIERVDAVETVNQALGEFAGKLERAQLTPVFRQPEDQVYMMADGRLVWRVMSNLLGNAVKYALPGTRIYLDLLEMDGKVIISMKNISREELNVNADELMERFVRGDASRNTEGSGLGLNIAQSLMELQKGQLQILVDGDLFKVTLIFPGE